MTFSLDQGGVVMSSQITHTTHARKHTIIKIHPLAHILDSRALIFSSSAFFSLSQPHHVTVSLPSPGDNPQSTGGRFERTQCQEKWLVKLIQLHMHQGSQLFPIFRAVSTIIPLLPKATFTSSIQPNLGLPRTRPPLISAINTILAIR